jgi:hypothetical protein
LPIGVTPLDVATNIRVPRPWFPPVLGIAILLLSLAFALKSNDRGALWCVAILSVSLVFEFWILRVGDHDSLGIAKTLTFAELAKGLFLALYWFVQHSFAEELRKPRMSLDTTLQLWQKIGIAGSIAAFAVACGVVALTFAIVSATENKKSRFHRLARQLHGNRTQTMCCMLLAFLHVTYLLTFSLALHDKAAPLGALRAASIDDEELSRPSPPAAPRESTCLDPDPSKIWILFFVDNDIGLESTKSAKEVIQTHSLENMLCARNQGGRLALLRTLGLPTSLTEDDLKVAAWNVRQVIELEHLFAAVHQNTRHRELVIEMHSHASDTLLRKDKDTFASQVEVSQLRANNVQLLLSNVARDVAGDSDPEPLFPTPIPVGNIDNFWLSPIAYADANGLNPKLSVELKIRPRKSASEMIMKSHEKSPLSLLDYTYFMIYTVTTTGYGDIAPSSNGAKFIVSIANLFELFFLVLVFNSLAGFVRGASDSAIQKLRFVTRRERFRRAALDAASSGEAAAGGVPPSNPTSEPSPPNA